jgi:homogentisate phytyltransferase/homogentisate geranylgeranyltransferase
MLRYRVAAMVALFMLLGAAHGPGLERPWALALAALALGSAYVAATAVNDVADEPLDRINHPLDAGRPLVAGEASAEDLWRLHVVAAVLALAASVPLGPLAVVLVALSLAVGHAYSLPPVALSYRTWAAPAVLSLAYVAVPYALGVTAAGGTPGSSDALFAAALVGLFVARIVLKDFRDRAGDARYGRPTLLLRFGKDATCAASAAALLAGAVLLLIALRPPLLVSVVLVGLLAAVGSALAMLHRAEPGHAEQVAIGIGARMGNGVLVSTLAWLVVVRDGGDVLEQAALVGLVGAAFAVGFATLVARPEEAVVGYKG